MRTSVKKIMEDFALEDFLETAEAAAAEVGPPPKYPPFDNSAWNWSPEVPQPKDFNLGAPVARQHLLWHGPAQNEIYEYLTIFEVVPLIRLSRAHQQFIEKEYCTRQLVLGSTLLYNVLYLRCRWFRAWVLRSLPRLERATFGYGESSTSITSETLEVLKAIMMRPPQNLRILIWLHKELQGCLAPGRRFYITFPSLQTLIWNAPGVLAAYIECPMLETAILGRSWDSMDLPANANYQRVLMDDLPQNMTSELCKSFDIEFYLSQSESIDTGTRLLQVLDDLKIRARGDTVHERPIELFAAITRLASSDWGLLDHLRFELGLPEQHKCRPDACVEWNRSGDWTAAQITSVWDKLMTLWHLHELIVPDDLKHALLHTSIGSKVRNDAPGMLELMKTCSLKNVCSGLYWLPLLRVETEEAEGRVPGRVRAIEINQRCAENISSIQLLGDIIKLCMKWMDQIKDPVNHIYFDFIQDVSFHESVRKVLNDSRETVEHVRAEDRRPLEGVILPNLKTFSCTYQGSAPLKLLREAKQLRHIEMPFESWASIYFQFQKEQELGSDRILLEDESPDDLTTPKRFDWPSDSQRIISHRLGFMDSFLRRDDKYDVIARMQVQFLVLQSAMQGIDQVYSCYELVYKLRKNYNHKLQVISCAVGWWEYPWDYAISEMTRGEVTEETWTDIRIATGWLSPDRLIPIWPEDAEITEGPRFWRYDGSKDEDPLTQQPKTYLGARKRPLIIVGRESGECRVEEIDNLSSLQRDGLERWYSELRSAIPSDLYTLCSPSFSLGTVSPTDKWFINALKARRVDQINKWIPISWLPTMDFTKINACNCPSMSRGGQQRFTNCRVDPFSGSRPRPPVFA